MTAFLQAIAMTAGMMLYVVIMLLVCLLYVSVPIMVVYGAMYALSKLAGHVRRRGGSSPRR